jgi:hypothetical protein
MTITSEQPPRNQGNCLREAAAFRLWIDRDLEGVCLSITDDRGSTIGWHLRSRLFVSFVRQLIHIIRETRADIRLLTQVVGNSALPWLLALAAALYFLGQSLIDQ